MTTTTAQRVATRWARLAVWAALTSVVLLFFRGWLGPELPASLRLEAMAPFTYVWQVADYLSRGYLFVDWDPSFFAGYPWLRFLQSAVYYAAALLSLLPGMSLPLALKVFVIGTYVVSAWTMCELVRTVTQDRSGETIGWAAGLIAGAAYAVFPFHMFLGVEILSHGAFWAVLPLPFLVYEQGRRREAAAGAQGVSPVHLGIAFALYGIVDIEHALLVGPFAALYIVLRELPALRRRWCSFLRTVAIGALIALGLLAYYIVPALGEVGQVGIAARFGEGGTADAQFARDTGLSIGALLAGAAARMGVTFRPADLPYIVFGFFGAHTWYLGLLVFGLALLGVAALLAQRGPGAAAASLILLLLAFAWAARAWLPVNLFEGIPFFGTLSGFRGMIHIAFLLCLLAGCGVAWLLAALPKAPARLLLALLAVAVLAVDRPRPTVSYAAEVALVVALLLGALWWGWRRTNAGMALAALLLVLLVVVDFRLTSNAVVDVRSYFAADELRAYQWLSQQGDGFRVWEYSDLYDDAEYLHTYSIAYNQTPRFGGYYDNGATRAQWRLYKWAKPERGRDAPVDETALRTALRLSAVRYVLVHARTATRADALRVLQDIGYDTVAWQTANVTIVEMGDWLPMARVYTSSGVLPADGPDELGQLARAEAANWAVYDSELGAADPLPAPLPMAAPPTPATTTRLSPYQIQVQADVDTAGLLVLAESWHGNWRVTVDGAPVELVRANVAFMGVRLDAGKHAVLYSYRPSKALYAGWLVTVLTIVALATWTVRAGARAR